MHNYWDYGPYYRMHAYIKSLYCIPEVYIIFIFQLLFNKAKKN